MINIQIFTFNSFQVNTYLLWDETGEAVVIDAACYEKREQEKLSSFISGNNLKIVASLNTHCHIDHVLGNGFISETYGQGPRYHADSEHFFHSVKEIGSSFGFTIGNIPEPGCSLQDGETVTFGNSFLKVLHTPGHADGSVCFYNEPQGFVITGDVLFRDTIGRTDLPTGDFDLLMKSIRTKLFTLPDETVALPGHGPETTLGYEKANNPFIR